MNPHELATALLFGIPFVTYAGLQHGLESLRAFTGWQSDDDPLGLEREPTNSAFESSLALRVAVAKSVHQYDAARDLIRRRYSWRGYGVAGHGEGTDVGGPSDPSNVTFVVETNDSLVGTVTLGLDGPRGLLAEQTHGGVIMQARENGCRVCEVTRLALDDGVDSRTVLALLLGLAHLVARKVHTVTDVFIEVNPRHVAFYSRALGFGVAAAERLCERVGAPSVLLRAELDVLEQRLAIMGRKRTLRPVLAQAA